MDLLGVHRQAATHQPAEIRRRTTSLFQSLDFQGEIPFATLQLACIGVRLL